MISAVLHRVILQTVLRSLLSVALYCCFFSLDKFTRELHLHGLFFRTQKMLPLPDDVFLKPIVLNEDTMIERLQRIIYTCSDGRCYGNISRKLEPAFNCMYYSFLNEFEIYFRIRVRQGRKEEAVMLGKKLLEEMNTLELSDVWDRDYTLSVLQDMIGVETRITLHK